MCPHTSHPGRYGGSHSAWPPVTAIQALLTLYGAIQALLRLYSGTIKALFKAHTGIYGGGVSQRLASYHIRAAVLVVGNLEVFLQVPHITQRVLRVHEALSS